MFIPFMQISVLHVLILKTLLLLKIIINHNNNSATKTMSYMHTTAQYGQLLSLPNLH